MMMMMNLNRREFVQYAIVLCSLNFPNVYGYFLTLACSHCKKSMALFIGCNLALSLTEVLQLICWKLKMTDEDAFHRTSGSKEEASSLVGIMCHVYRMDEKQLSQKALFTVPGPRRKKPRGYQLLRWRHNMK